MSELWKTIQRHVGVIPDGDPGPATAKAVAQHLGVVPPKKTWPRDGGARYGQQELYDFYGSRGSSLVKLEMPYPMMLDWDEGQVVRGFSVHEKCHDAFLKMFEKTLDHFGNDGVKQLGLNRFGGCYNNRKKRGGTSWSTHAWAAAVDLWPEMNRLHWGKDRAEFGKSIYDPFWAIVEECGLVSLGREKDYDWMHIQAVSV